ncbi:MAG: hydantoinase/oxoprolinase family protein, partial [Dethiobacter sp.]|nr:hydantoinase/oxoprolinase family protein [Dethiobacter sp.]
CYRLGGKQPTVTDANLLLGRIDPDYFLAGKMILDKDASFTAINAIADQLNLSVMDTAQGILDIANAKMADAIRQLTIQKGIDPREFMLVAFGGAGPMHAVFIAEELNITQILVPSAPGAFSAWGMLQSDIRQDAVRTFNAGLANVSHQEVKETYDEMQKEVDSILYKQNIKEEQIEYVKTADLRYSGQEFTVNVAFDQNTVNQASIHTIKEKFHLRHDQIYGHSNPSGLVEIVNLRLAGIGKVKKVLKQHFDFSAKPLKERSVNKATFYGKVYDTCVYDRNRLFYGHKFNGPAIVEELSATTVIPPGYIAWVDSMESIVIEKES